MDYENENRAPRLLAATWSLTVVAGVFLGLRLYCKRIRSTGLWWDDHFMLAAWPRQHFVVVTVNLFLNSVWITGFAKCQPIEKVWDGSVPGTCWDKKKLAKWQTFASCKGPVGSILSPTSVDNFIDNVVPDYSSIIDFVLAFLPWKTLLKMTMPLRERIGVTVAMSMGVISSTHQDSDSISPLNVGFENLDDPGQEFCSQDL
ncbi:WD40 repeat-containing protein [Apiospora arundinis]